MGHRTTIAAIVVGLVAATAPLALSDPVVSAEAASGSFSKIMVVVLENTDYDDAIEKPSWLL